MRRVLVWNILDNFMNYYSLFGNCLARKISNYFSYIAIIVGSLAHKFTWKKLTQSVIMRKYKIWIHMHMRYWLTFSTLKNLNMWGLRKYKRLDYLKYAVEIKLGVLKVNEKTWIRKNQKECKFYLTLFYL